MKKEKENFEKLQDNNNINENVKKGENILKEKENNIIKNNNFDRNESLLIITKGENELKENNHIHALSIHQI